jgi:transcriptional regulator with XRE-family HTH domain
MSHLSEHLLAQVRDARDARGMSQRAISDRAGLTQSHISQIESGKMEPGLSSFIELARALDLEVMLVPKRWVAGVQALVKAHARPVSSHIDQAHDKELARAERIVKKMKALHGSASDLEHIAEDLHFLRRTALTDQEMRLVRDMIQTLERHQASPPIERDLKNVMQTLQRVRHATAGVPAAPGPAYTLDDDDGASDA